MQVMASGSKSCLTHFQAESVKRRMPLGSCAATSLAAAGKAVRVVIGDAARGIDAAAERKAELDALTLGKLIDQCRGTSSQWYRNDRALTLELPFSIVARRSRAASLRRFLMDNPGHYCRFRIVLHLE
jgi:hypothetical protein